MSFHSSLSPANFTLASAYGQSSYNNSAQYNGTVTTTGGGTTTTPPTTGNTTTGTTTTVSGDSSGNSSGGVLTNTGFAIVLAVSVACVLLFAAVIIRFWKRPNTKSI